MGSTSLEECLTLLGAERDGAPLLAHLKGEKRSRKMARKVEEKRLKKKTVVLDCSRVGNRATRNAPERSRFAREAETKDRARLSV